MAAINSIKKQIYKHNLKQIWENLKTDITDIKTDMTNLVETNLKTEMNQNMLDLKI